MISPGLERIANWPAFHTGNAPGSLGFGVVLNSAAGLIRSTEESMTRASALWVIDERKTPQNSGL